MTDGVRWEMLQTRWAQGEWLSPAEEQERLVFAARDAAARRELELFAALRARGVGEGEAVSEGFVESVLKAVADAPRLRLVGTNEAEALPGPVKVPASPWRPWSLAAACLVLVAAFAGARLARSTAATASTPAVTQLVPSRSSPRLPLPDPARAELVLSAGEVLLDGRSARVERRALAIGQVLATGVGRACFTIDPAIDVCLAEQSRIKLESLVASSIRVRVEAGLALASLSRRNPGSTFALLAGDVSAVAHGTIFAARHDHDEAEVVVVEGSVDVARGVGSSEQVGAHSRVRIRSSGSVVERSKVDQVEAEQLLALRATHGIWLHAAFGVLELASSSATPIRASVDGDAALPLPLQSVVGVGRHQVRWRDAADHELTSWTDVSSGETRRLEAPLGHPAPAPSAATTEKPAPAALLDAARAEVSHGNPRAALGLYEKLRSLYPASAEAHTVLPTIGKLCLDLGDAARALRTFDAYLREAGTLAPEALSGRIRALRALGQRAAEREAIQQYLARYPQGLEGPRLQKRLAELDAR